MDGTRLDYGRNPRLGGMFVALALLTAALALLGPHALTVLLWPAMSWLLVGVAYLGRVPSLFTKHDGRLDISCKLVLAPHLALLYATWRAVRAVSREPAFARLTDAILIGRRLLLHEYPPVRTVVDLTAEMDEQVPPGSAYVPIPILDAAPLSPGALREAARRVAACEAPVYLHCAEGHGRTSMLAAATLLETGAAASAEEALEMVRRVRPRARPNAGQSRALAAAWPRG
jgi:hypothetical protein